MGTPKAVWPWLVQQGYYRVGWYTPRCIDAFVNPLLFGTPTKRRQDDRLIPEYQTLEVGEIVADGPDYAVYFRVLEVRPLEAIVYHSIRHPWRPNPVDPRRPTSLAKTETRLRREGVYLDFTWNPPSVVRPAAANRMTAHPGDSPCSSPDEVTSASSGSRVVMPTRIRLVPSTAEIQAGVAAVTRVSTAAAGRLPARARIVAYPGEWPRIPPSSTEAIPPSDVVQVIANPAESGVNGEPYWSTTVATT